MRRRAGYRRTGPLRIAAPRAAAALSRTVSQAHEQDDAIENADDVTETAPPAMPSRGAPNPPRISAPDKGICTAAPANIISAGVFMSPVPRNTAPSSAISQMATLPANRMPA